MQLHVDDTAASNISLTDTSKLAQVTKQQGQQVASLQQQLQKQHSSEQQGQRVEALEKQLQKLQEVGGASRQEVEKLSRQLYLKRPQVPLLVI